MVGKAQPRQKCILESQFDTSLRETLPTAFTNRRPFQAVFDFVVRSKRSRREVDRDDSQSPDQRLKPSLSSRGAGMEPKTGPQGGAQYTRPIQAILLRVAQVQLATSLFAPPASRDVANELDLLLGKCETQ